MIAFILGFIVGEFVGALIACIMVVGSANEDEEDGI